MRRLVDTLGSRVAAEIAVENTGDLMLTRNAICNRRDRGRPVRTERPIAIAASYGTVLGGHYQLNQGSEDSIKRWEALCGRDVFLKDSDGVWTVQGYRSMDGALMVREKTDLSLDIDEAQQDSAGLMSRWISYGLIECTVADFMADYNGDSLNDWSD